MIRRITLLALVVSLATFALSCGPIAARGGGGGGGSFGAACRGDLGASAAANQFEAFMAATYEFNEAATSAQRTLVEACQRMGGILGMNAGDLEGGPERTREICDAVTAHIREEMAAVRAASNTTVELRTQPPHCEARFEAYASCAASCDASITPGQLQIQCEGGEIRGGCSAQCTGRCAVDVQARCSGVCEGACEGTCSARAADGSCAGRCDGTCRGECVAEVSGQCSGECRGGCSVEWQQPYCTGSYTPPQVSAECRAACDARVEAQMECTPGQAELVVSGGPNAETQARAQRLAEAVREGLIVVLTVRERVERLVRSGQAVLTQLQGLPNAIRSVGVAAAACSAGAIASLTESVAATSVTLDVSVSVSASFSASAG